MLSAHGTAASLLTWHPHPDVWALVLLLGGGYLWALRFIGPSKVAEGHPVATGKQKVLFFGGLITLWLGADWPLHDLSEGSSFAAHMVQHLIFAFVSPPLLLLGSPKWMLRALLAPPRLFKAMRFLTRPLVALIVFNTAIALLHWPAVVDLQLRYELGHFAVHFGFVAAALLMWWPVVAPLPEMPSLSAPAKMFYLFLQSIVPTVPASFLTFATEPLYKAYEGMAHPWGMSTLTDQLVAGLIMKLGGGLLLWGIITAVFFRWYAREERQEAVEVPWDDFERELEAWDLRR